MTLKEEVIKKLSRKFYLYVDMIYGLKSGKAEVEYADEYGVILYYKETEIYSVCVFKKSKTDELLKKLVRPYCDIVAHDLYTLKRIKSVNEVESFNTCYNIVWKGDLPKMPDVLIKPLTMDYLDVVSKAYTLYDARSEMEKLIGEKKLSGAFMNGELAGFIGFHLDGSMGMLYVFTKYRNRGIGGSLTLYQTRKQIIDGNIPFGQIIKTNTASKNLHKKLGFKFSKPKISWINLK